MPVQEQVVTAQDLWKSSHGSAAKRYELNKGVLVEMAPMGDIHGIVTNWLAYLITGFVAAHDLGEVTAAETGFELSKDPDTVRAPDIAFIASARLMPLTGKYYSIAPDLAVEVISPGDSASEINDKIQDYFGAGVRLVWLVYPRSETVHVFTAADQVHIHKTGDVLDGGDVLPGFTLPVGNVFQRVRPLAFPASSRELVNRPAGAAPCTPASRPACAKSWRADD